MLSGAFAEGIETATTEEAVALLRSVSERYQKLESFHFEAIESTISSVNGRERRTDSVTVTAADTNGRFRVESDHPVDGGVAVFDGDVSSIYLARQHQYTQLQGQPLSLASRREGSVPALSALKNRFSSRYRHIGVQILEAKIEGEETLNVDQGEVVCTVVWARYDLPQGIAAVTVEKKFWIDPTRRVIWRDGSKLSVVNKERGLIMEAVQNVSFRTARIAEPLPDELFVFIPPEGARYVHEFEPVDLVGQKAFAFELEDLDGVSRRLKELRGKIVLLDFWASWCMPCRIDLPRVEALHQELQDEGLVILGVNSEDPETARAFLEEHSYSFPTLLDPSKSLTREFEVRVLPTVVVIDCDGKVASYLVGAHSAEDLRAAIREAGLD